jgi:hypothetical protein
MAGDPMTQISPDLWKLTNDVFSQYGEKISIGVVSCVGTVGIPVLNRRLKSLHKALTAKRETIAAEVTASIVPLIEAHTKSTLDVIAAHEAKDERDLAAAQEKNAAAVASVRGEIASKTAEIRLEVAEAARETRSALSGLSIDLTERFNESIESKRRDTQNQFEQLRGEIRSQISHLQRAEAPGD